MNLIDKGYPAIPKVWFLTHSDTMPVRKVAYGSLYSNIIFS